MCCTLIYVSKNNLTFLNIIFPFIWKNMQIYNSIDEVWDKKTVV